MNMSTIKKRVPWTEQHVGQLLTIYFAFLASEQRGDKYVKAGPVRELAEKQGRSKGSVEAKMMNVSAVLQAHGKPWVNGYKPLPNYNKALVDQVMSRIS